MHELQVTQSILDIALRHAGEAKRIIRINLVIGDLSSFVGESVKFYWDMLSKDTIAEGADLHFKRIRTRFHCTGCEYKFESSDSRDFICPECGSKQVRIIAGKEFRMESIEVE